MVARSPRLRGLKPQRLQPGDVVQDQELDPAPLPRSQLAEIVESYQVRVLEGQSVDEIRAQSRFFRPEIRELLDRELDRLVNARVKR